jgi:hypothetical protein
MLRKYLSTALLPSTLMLGFVLLATGPNTALARATGVVATITAIDNRTGAATLTTEAGEEFIMDLSGKWKVGNRVECDRVEDATQVRLQHCQPWQ